MNKWPADFGKILSSGKWHTIRDATSKVQSGACASWTYTALGIVAFNNSLINNRYLQNKKKIRAVPTVLFKGFIKNFN